MPSKTNPGDSMSREDSNAFLNDYLADWDGDDPFRSPSPEPGQNTKPNEPKNNKNDKKRKTDVLGIDEELDVAKKARAPRVKLDEARLLSDKGIPKLRKTAPRLKLKGKGHEFSDAARLLSFYQEWLDDLFPKATFLDALAMIEKIGHKTVMRNQRLQWIDEGRPKSKVDEDNEDQERPHSLIPKESSRIAPIFEKTAQARASTPTNDDLFGEEDIYGATPRASIPSKPAGDIPDDDDIEALVAEADAASGPSAPPFRSIFGGGLPKKPTQSAFEPDEEDDLEALMAEAEAQTTVSKPPASSTAGGIMGGGAPKKPAQSAFEPDHDEDLEAIMAEVEANAQPVQSKPAQAPESAGGSGKETLKQKPTPAQDTEYDDDLDALMAEVDGQPGSKKSANGAKPAQAQEATEADEEAMAEMGGLW